MDNSAEINRIELIGKEEARERLRRWIERGFDRHAVAVYGTSTQVLEQILKEGQLPPSSIEVNYQKKLVEGGGYLYYALPFVDRVAKINQNLAREVIQRLPGNLLNDLNTDNIKLVAKFYAINNAIVDNFFELTGIKTDPQNILFLANEIVPEGFKTFTKKIDIDLRDIAEMEDINHEKDESVIADIKSKLTPSQLSPILSACLEKRGVFIYLNEEFLKKNKAFTCFEAEDEIVVVADKPILLSAISGIEVLSNADIKALNRYL